MGIDPDFLLGKFYQLQAGIYFNKPINLGWVKVYTHDLLDDEFNNHALIYSLEGDCREGVETIEELLRERNRKPALYIAPFSKPQDVRRVITDFGYKLSFSDAWMIYKNTKDIKIERLAAEVVKIKTGEEIRAYGEVIRLGYSGPKSFDSPYGGVPMENFIIVSQKALRDQQFKNRLEGYLIKSDKRYVAAGLLLRDGKCGYVAGIASIPEARGKGFGKLISQFITNRSLELGNEVTFLGTELSSRNEEFYRRLGYKTIFTGHCCVK
ncbi:GNAT family N-acetyltransferase [Candidatus Shapirobacteria bacterium]|nr:GNAT family N-acetyltransferase [Candidatus Shapirobacteria bacterium]